MNKVFDVFFMFVLTVAVITIAVLVGTIAIGVLHEVGFNMNNLKDFDIIPLLAYGVLGLWSVTFLIAFFMSCINGTSL